MSAGPLCLTPPRVLTFALEHLAAIQARRICDAGTGTGAWAARARDAGYEVSGADLDPGACQVPDLEVARVDLSGPWPWTDDAFDAVTSFEVIEHLENPFRALREAVRVLRPGGRLICSIPNGASMDRRIRYLLTGSAHRPDAPGRRPATGPQAEGLRHRRAWGAGALVDAVEQAGARVLEVRSAGRPVARWYLAPLALAVRTVARLWPRRRRPQYRLSLVNRWALLLGSGSLVLAAEKPLSAA